MSSSNDFSQFRAPEGNYVCTDWTNPILNRSAAQHGGNNAASNAPDTYPTHAPTRLQGVTDTPRMISVCVRVTKVSNTQGIPPQSVSDICLDPTQVAQGISADCTELASVAAKRDSSQREERMKPGPLQSTAVLSEKPTIPSTGMKSNHSAFITRVNVMTDLGKLFSQRTDSVSLTFVVASKSLIWYADVGSRFREPIARVSFSSTPCSLDVNQFTQCTDRLDVVVGFASGDLLWIEPVSLRYSRINKNGVFNASAVRQVRWLPCQESLFLSAHADGTMIILDRDREDVSSTAHLPEPDAHWNYNETLYVSHSPTGSTSEDATSYGWRLTKPKEVAWSSLNPLSCWRVSRQGVTNFAFSPDNTQVAVTAEDGVLRIIDLYSESLIRSFASYFGGLECVVWSPDGRLLLTGGQDDLLTLWAMHEGHIVARLQGHRSFVTGIAFDPWCSKGTDGCHRMISIGEDCLLCLWDFSPDAVLRPRGSGRHQLGLRDESVSARGNALQKRSVFVPAASLSEVAMLQPSVIAVIPGRMLTDVRVSSRGLLLLHADAQLDWFARPHRNARLNLATDLDTEHLANSDADTSNEIKSPSRSGLSLPFGRGIPSLRKRTSQMINGSVAS